MATTTHATHPPGKKTVKGPCFPCGPKPAPSPASCPTCDQAQAQSLDETFDGFIVIKGTQKSTPVMRRWLQALKATGVGAVLLDELSTLARGNRLILLYFPLAEIGNPFTGPWQTVCPPAYDDTDALYDPTTGAMYPATSRATLDQFSISWNDSLPDPKINPGACIIGHELIHVLHGMTGEALYGYDAKDRTFPAAPGRCKLGESVPDNLEEARTIGLRGDGYFGQYLSENEIRAELGAPLRSTHANLPGTPGDDIHASYTDPTPWPVVP